MSAFAKARFIMSAPSLSSFKGDAKPMVLMVGRSNVGKSTLINALLGQKIAFASKKAGKTKALNFFFVDESFYLVDAPGYGTTDFATMSTVQFSTLMEETLPDPRLKVICLLIDMRVKPNPEDEKFYHYLQRFKKPIVCVLTKMDKMNQSERFAAIKRAEELGFTRALPSDLKPASVAKIAKAIEANI